MVVWPMPCSRRNLDQCSEYIRYCISFMVSIVWQAVKVHCHPHAIDGSGRPMAPPRLPVGNAEPAAGWLRGERHGPLAELTFSASILIRELRRRVVHYLAWRVRVGHSCR